MTYIPEYILDPDQVGLLRENMSEVVRIVALPDEFHAGKWLVAAETVIGQGLILKTGLQRQVAMEMADESERCLLTLRTHRDYPADRIVPPAAPAAPKRATIELLANRIHYMENDGTPPKPRDTPARRAEAKARELEPLKEMSLKEIAADRAVPAGAWERIGAQGVKPAPKLKKVYWRKLGMTARGSGYRWSSVHYQGPIAGHTLCGTPYPSETAYKIRTRMMPNPPAYLCPCRTCLRIAKEGC